MTRPAIDWKRIEDLREELGCDGLEEIMEIFFEDTAEMIAGLEGAPAGELSDRLHGIKGSAQNMGFGELADLCRAGEWALKRCDTVDVSRFGECYRRSCAMLTEAFPDQIRNSASVVSSVISV